jgi:hypothetical protein
VAAARLRTGRPMTRARHVRQADLSLSKRFQVPARALLSVDRMDNGKPTTKTISSRAVLRVKHASARVAVRVAPASGSHDEE